MFDSEGRLASSCRGGGHRLDQAASKPERRSGRQFLHRGPATIPPRSRPGKQAGLSLISWLIVIVVAGLVVYGAFRVVPAYIESARLGSALASIKQDARTKSVGALRTELSNQLMIDSLGDVKLDNFKFALNGNQLTISIDQPIDKSWIGNLGFVIHSRHSITVTRGDGG